MEVIQVRLKILLKEDIPYEDSQEVVCKLIDTNLATKGNLLDFHYENKYKFYCFDCLYPIERDRLYKSEKTYTLTIRTTSLELGSLFSNELKNSENAKVKVLSSDIRIIPKKHIEKIYSITPAILKMDDGYWKGNISVDDYERRLKENLIKKYNQLSGESMEEDFQFITSMSFDNKKPVAINYKDINLLGDKLTLHISENPKAQELAYLSLGSGLLEMNSRGAGFVNYKWI